MFFFAVGFDWKLIAMSYPAQFKGWSAWMRLENLLILAQTVLDIYSGEAVEWSIFVRFLNFDNCPPEVVRDVVSG